MRIALPPSPVETVRRAAGRSAAPRGRLRVALFAIVGLVVLIASVPTALARAAIAVRVGTHPDYTRLVFDFKQPVSFHVWSAGTGAAITFPVPLHFDAAFGAAKPRILKAGVALRGQQTIVDLTLAKGIDIRYFEDGIRLVVDAVGPVPKLAQAPRSSTIRKTVQKTVARSQAANGHLHRKASSQPVAQKTEPSRRHQLSDAREKGANAIEAAAIGRPSPKTSGPVVSSPPANPTVSANVASDGGHLQLTFPWPEPVAAAVFKRAGWVWIVFDHPAHLDLTALAQNGMPVVWQATQVGDKNAAIVRLRLAPGWVPVVSGTNTLWRIDFITTGTAALPVSVPVEIEPRAQPLPRVFLAVPEAGQVLTVADPTVGDKLTVVTVGKPGLGLAGPRHFAQFSLLATAQGLALTEASDKLAINASSGGIAVRAAGGLLLSTAPIGHSAGPAVPDTILHFGRRWAGPPDRFEATKQKLQFALVQAPAGGLTEARYALAEFYFANGLDAEAEGVLDRLVARAPIAATEVRFQLLHGAVLFGLQRYDEAVREFQRPDLAPLAEAALWRGAAEAAKRDWTKALANLQRGRNVLAAYPPAIRARFELAIARAELGTHDPDGAATTLAFLRNEHPNPATVAESYYLSGAAADQLGKTADAKSDYEKAVASNQMAARVRSKLALTELALKKKRLTPAEAIRRLNTLRFAWGGGVFEDRVLRVLGGLYLERHRYRKALATWRTVVTYFPNLTHTAEIKNRMQATFQQLFLNGGADQLSALKAIGLFYDFRDLTPNNAEGDAIVRKLARRLVSVDLLSQAEQLLHYQMTYRLSAGPEKARVGAELGKVYLLDQRPKMTLAALNESTTAPLSGNLVEERRNLEVAALVELGRYDDAIQALASATDGSAETLRAGIYWRARKWPEEVATLGHILGQRYANPAPLSTTQRRDVLRLAVALVMSGNDAALERLRTEYAPRLVGTPQAEPFRAITEKIGTAGDSPSAAFIANLDRLQGFLTHYGVPAEGSG